MSQTSIDDVRIKFQKLSIQKGWKQKYKPKPKQKSPENKPKEEIWNIVEENIEDSFSPVKTIPRALMEEICEEKNSFEKLPQRIRFIDNEASADDASEDEEEEFENGEQDSFINDDDEEEFSKSEETEEDEQEGEAMQEETMEEQKEEDISIDFNESVSDGEKENSPKKEHSIIEISDEETEEQKENVLQNNRPSNINNIPSHRLSTQVFHDSPIQEEKKKNIKANTFVKEREKYLKYYYDQFNIRIFDEKLPKVKNLLF
jgi:hypothetical protein